MPAYLLCAALLAVLALLSLSPPAWAAASVLYNLGLHSNEAENSGDRRGGSIGAVRGPDGSVYVASGSRFGSGLIGRYNGNGSFTALHEFSAGRLVYDLAGAPVADLTIPQGTPVVASDGNLYGATFSGGVNGVGGVWQMTLSGPDAGQYRVVYSFSCAQGCNARSSPIEGADGNLYGTVVGGQCGPAGCDNGAIYRLTRTGIYTPLHIFAAAAPADGALPYAPPVEGLDGALYGTTTFGGTPFANCSNNVACEGVVWRVTPSGAYSVLHRFQGDEGGRPFGALAVATDGRLYGTNSEGGYLADLSHTNGGTVWRITPNGGSFSLLAYFSDRTSPNPGDGNPGQNPYAGLVRIGSNFYGLTRSGGYADPAIDPQCGRGGFFSSHGGTFFRMNGGGKVTKLFCFDGSEPTLDNGSDGLSPSATLTLGADGRLYGTTDSSGTVPAGTYNFNPDVAQSYGAGTVFSLSSGGNFRRLATLHAPPSEGQAPSGPLTLASDGNYYGVTYTDRKDGQGTIFQLTPAGVLTTTHVLHNDSHGTDGYHPESGLVQGPDGRLYGVAREGGSNGIGSVFRVDPATGGYTTLHSFNDATDRDGSQPDSALVAGPDGRLYGLASGGGAHGAGTIFRITTGGRFTKVHDFDGSFGTYPHGRLHLADDGFFYGTAQYGGANNAGTVFRLRPDSTSLKLIYSFAPGIAGQTYSSQQPLGGVTQGLDGALYGSTSGCYEGCYRGGSIFRLNLSGSNFKTLYDFGPSNDRRARSALTRARDGNFYGTFSSSGGGDQVYRITPGGRFSVIYEAAKVIIGNSGYVAPEAPAQMEDEPVQGADGRLITPARQLGRFVAGAVLAIDGPADRVATISVTAGSRQASLSWPATAGASTYTVYVASSATGKLTRLKTGVRARGATASYTATSLTAGQTYYFAVTAVNDLGEAVASDLAAIVPGS